MTAQTLRERAAGMDLHQLGEELKREQILLRSSAKALDKIRHRQRVGILAAEIRDRMTGKQYRKN